MKKLNEIEMALKEYGLNTEQSSVYMFLIENGDATPLLISKATKVPRTTVYRILDELRNMGVVSIFKKNNISNYSAENPRRLVNRLKEKEAVLNKIIPEIDDLFINRKGNPRVKLYTGENGAKIGLDLLYEYLGKHSIHEVYTYSDSEIIEQIPKYLSLTAQKREGYKIHMRMIAPEAVKDQGPTYLKHYEENKFKSVRFLPRRFKFEGTILFGGGMAVLFSLKDHQLHTVVIESESIVKMYMQQFTFAWEMLG